MIKSRKEYKAQWRQTPKAAYSIQKTNAKSRGIAWELSFDEWWALWEESGKYFERGSQPYNYCMCRKQDTGPYSKENVRIDTVDNNHKEHYSLMYINPKGQLHCKKWLYENAP